MQVDRVTSDDVISLATDVGPVPMQVGAVLRLAGTVSEEQVRERVEERLPLVPRLRQCLLFPPLGAGRPVWVDEADFDVSNHVSIVECASPGDEESLLAVATDAVTRRLPMNRPLWRIVVVTGLASDECAIVVAFHHVLADGIGGLAVLASLVDHDVAVPHDRFPRPAPATRALYVQATRERIRWLFGIHRSMRRFGSTLSHLRPRAGRARAGSTSLNRPTGAERHLSVVRVDLADVHRSAHAHDATVNDVVLAAVGAALGRLLEERREHLDEITVSVPVSARRSAQGTALGNEVGVVPIVVPVAGDASSRLERVAAATRAAKSAPRVTSSALIGPVFRILARLGIFKWFIDRQRLVNTFVTNLRGPEETLHFVRAPITEVAAVAMITGNVTASFAVLSYAGSLTVTLIADPETCPDHERLTELVSEELDLLCREQPTASPTEGA